MYMYVWYTYMSVWSKSLQFPQVSLKPTQAHSSVPRGPMASFRWLRSSLLYPLSQLTPAVKQRRSRLRFGKRHNSTFEHAAGSQGKCNYDAMLVRCWNCMQVYKHIAIIIIWGSCWENCMAGASVLFAALLPAGGRERGRATGLQVWYMAALTVHEMI